jgi:FMN phosphatase YigB (HAD superfamily)
MVGDHAEKDVKGASDFGMRALLYDPEDSYPDFTGEKIRDLRELLKLI